MLDFSDFGKSLGLPNLSKLNDVFNFTMSSVTLNKALSLLDEAGMSEVKKNITDTLGKVQVGHLC